MFSHNDIIVEKSPFLFSMCIAAVIASVLCIPQPAFASKSIMSIKYGWMALDKDYTPVLNATKYPLLGKVSPVKYISDGKRIVEVNPKSVVYLENNKPGKSLALIIGDNIIGPYCDAFITSFTIVKETTDVSSMSISGVVDRTYTGKEISPSVKVNNGVRTLKLNSDYKVLYSNNKNVGTASVTITGKGRYTGSKTLNFKIKPVDISKARAIVSDKMNYTGKKLTPVPKVTFNKKTLKISTDFSLSYDNNKKIGTATVTVKGKGNFTGSKNVSFKISKPPRENIIVVSDIHQRTKKLNETLSYWKNKKIKPVAVINAGDLSELGRKAHFKAVKKAIDKQFPGIPQLTVLGNHDAHWADNYDFAFGGKDTRSKKITDRDLRYFKEVFKTTNPYVKTTHANIIGIGEPPHYSYKVLNSGNLKLLKTRLDETKREGKWAIVVCHYPGNAKGSGKRLIDVGGKLISILKYYPNTVYVAGHVHEHNNAPAVKKKFGVICSTSQSVLGAGESRLFSFSSDGTLTIKRYAPKQGTKTLGSFKKK